MFLLVALALAQAPNPATAPEPTAATERPATLVGVPAPGGPAYEAMAHDKRIESLGRLKALVATAEGHTKAEILLRTADLLFQESGYLWRKEDPSWSEWMSKADAIFAGIVDGYPSYARRSQALYFHALAAGNLGRRSEAVKALDELLQNHPEADVVANGEARAARAAFAATDAPAP